MNSNHNFLSYLRVPILTILMAVFYCTSMSASDDEINTNIILINGMAVLADFDSKGEVIKEYSEIPYYFSSYQSHETIVQKSMVKYKGLSAKPHKSFDLDHFLAYDHFDRSICNSSYDLLNNDQFTANFNYASHSSLPDLVGIRQKRAHI